MSLPEFKSPCPRLLTPLNCSATVLQLRLLKRRLQMEYSVTWNTDFNQEVLNFRTIYTIPDHNCEFNFIYAHKPITTLSAPIFTKLVNAQQNYVQIDYIEFHSNGTINVGSTIEIRSALFWDITQRTVVIPCWRFGTTYRFHFQGQRSQSLELLEPSRWDRWLSRNVGT